MASEPLSETDGAVIRRLAQRLLDGDEDPLLKLAVRTSTVAVDRWGRDLERDAGEQRYPAFEATVEETAADVIAHYRTPEGDLDGVDGVVFEGRQVTVETLTDAALRVTEIVEDAAPRGFDRHEPGGLVERAGGEL